MKVIYSLITIVIIFSTIVVARESGETEITTDDGIEVFQNEKYYLLKKNVRIVSDNFILSADDVKIDFDQSLYDITEINAQGDVKFNSTEYSIKGNSKSLKFEVKEEILNLKGAGSELITEDIVMISDGTITLNNLNGNFSLQGMNSKLTNDSILIQAESINGIFSNTNNKKEIIHLNIIDNKISYIKNNDTDMYAKKINFDNELSTIELIEDVTIIRNEEKITGDYGTLDTKNNSYKIKSNNKTKVKVIIQNDE